MARFIARIGRALSTHYLHLGGTRVLLAEPVRGFLGTLGLAVWESGLARDYFRRCFFTAASIAFKTWAGLCSS